MPSGPSITSTNGHQVSWAAILGQWQFDGGAQYLGAGPDSAVQSQFFPVGVAISNLRLQNGHCDVIAEFGEAPQGTHAAGIVLGYRSPEHSYIVAQLGATNAYTLAEYVPGFGWRPLASAGQADNLRAHQKYGLELRVSGQELKMLVDDVPVLEHLLAHPLEGRQAGLLANGTAKVEFSNFTVKGSKPKAFVVMQFAEPYDTFYQQVIQGQAEAAGFDVARGDEKAGPGIIFQDVQREIQQAEVVIAEISPTNPNVFYELGYAHALGKPTILLARRGSDLPFDIKSFRVVFYNDTIGGKAEVERNLGKHLRAIAEQ